MSDNTFEVKWRIENAISWFETRNDTLYSSQFLAGTLKNTRWKLRLSLNSQLGEKYISFSLQRDIEDDFPQTINLNYELLFIASDGTLLKSKRCTDKFDPKTVSQELNVKQSVILEEEKEAYFAEGVLTVCCQLWKGSNFSYGRSCLIQTVIGKKCIKVNTTIDNLSPPSIMNVNFMPPSTDISLLSLDVYVGSDEFIFKRKHVECKSFSWYLCKLFALGSNGEEIGFKERNDLTNQLILNNAEVIQSMPPLDHLIRKGTLSLQLEITYYPGVVSESTRIMF
ncbi:hypothetical protein AVEN_157370-1 [Araneus ventricosus]|uniref:MATH domain-containing protein n=1 Tax=Araneus ventricosus TaxID=182803 RepID=A0A4Y2WGH1_ARAVE|nr:hypothetical protein AVEN_45052-1 [Araneus ventricosus]GBO35117.1 hypothetical protein AVEN_157370-1 [Araneus ventricosus]